jgi:cytochrome c-type biogenesis protein CcmF
MPWLLGTALLHCIVVVERGGVREMDASARHFTFAIAGGHVHGALGSSVHAFALDPARGIFILGLQIAAAGKFAPLQARTSGSWRVV